MYSFIYFALGTTNLLSLFICVCEFLKWRQGGSKSRDSYSENLRFQKFIVML